MSILFSDIYEKAIALFDDPKITVAYQTNIIQFDKLMYTYLQNAITMFHNPASIALKLASYNEPSGVMQVWVSDGANSTLKLDDAFEIKENSEYLFVEGELTVEGVLDKDSRTVTFPDVLPEGKEYAFEQYYVGEFLDTFTNFNKKVPGSDTMVQNTIKDILARLLVRAWGEGERNLLLDIRNILQDTDFKLTPNNRILDSKNEWIDQLDSEIFQLQNRLAWMIRFTGSSTNIGRG